MKPENLLSDHVRLSPLQSKALSRLGVKTVRDLLYYFPVRYGDVAEVLPIREIAKGEEVVLYGTLSHLTTKKAFKKKNI